MTMSFAYAAMEVMPNMARDYVIWLDPYLNAKTEPIKPHSKKKVIGSIINAPDGSGDWEAFHFFNDKGEFIQGGWQPKYQ